MNTVGYSIFNHAQLGHIDRKPIRPQAAVQRSAEPAPVEHKARPERGWAVELGLGLGPAFNKRRKLSE